MNLKFFAMIFALGLAFFWLDKIMSGIKKNM